MNRRGFLRGLLATTALVAAPKVIEPEAVWTQVHAPDGMWTTKTPDEILSDINSLYKLMIKAETDRQDDLLLHGNPHTPWLRGLL